MPDLLFVFAKRWKLILVITLLSVVIALLFVLLSPKKYLSVATALPSNSATADKSRIFSSNIEALYSGFGTPDELDRIEGTAVLDTIFIVASKELHLPEHYFMSISGEGPFKAAMRLKRNTRINRSSYGELKVKVWDRDRNMAATLANFLMQKLQELHQHLQNQNNFSVLDRLNQEYALKQNEYLQLTDSLDKQTDTPGLNFASARKEIIKARRGALTDQIQQYQKMIGEYELAVSVNSPVLLVVENARPPLWPDKPKVLPTVLFTFFGALLFSYLLALFIERKKSSE